MSLGSFPKILLGGLLALAVWFVLAVEFSVIHSPADVDSYAAYEQTAKEYINSTYSLVVIFIKWFGGLDHDDWLAFLTGIIAIFTGVLAWSTVRLWTATEKNLQILVNTERPNMQVTSLSVGGLHTQPNEEGKVILLVKYELRNFGRTVAFLQGECLHCAIDKELPTDPGYGPATQLRWVIGNGTGPNTAYAAVNPIALPYKAEDIRDVLMGEQNLYIYGFFIYGGAGPKPHKTSFAYRMIFDGDASNGFRPAGPPSYWENY